LGLTHEVIAAFEGRIIGFLKEDEAGGKPPPATARWKARVRAASLPSSYTTRRDTTPPAD
jgi:hypothetical protein